MGRVSDPRRNGRPTASPLQSSWLDRVTAHRIRKPRHHAIRLIGVLGMNERDPFSHIGGPAGSWHELKRRQKRAVVVFFLWFPTTVVVSFLSVLLIGREADLGFIFGLTWMASLAREYILLISWRCPKCGKPFMWGNRVAWPFVSKCIHCGLPKYTNP